MDIWDEDLDPDEIVSIGEYPEAERPVAVQCDTELLHVKLADGRTISTPLWWYPRLLNATHEERNHVELLLGGVHWPDVDEDLSVDGMLKGRRVPGAVEPEGAEKPKAAAAA